MEDTYIERIPAEEELNGETAWERIFKGEAPKEEYELGELSEGIDFITEFWGRNYLDEYIREGGSKMKFITGRRGSGKSHLMQLVSVMAGKKSYVTVDFSAKDVWMHDFKEIYLEIINQCNLMECLNGCADRIIENMGYDPKDIAADNTFVDYLSQKGEADPITKREIRQQLREMFWENPHMDNNFALACSHLTGAILGHPFLEPQNREILLGWLHCDKTVRLLHLRALGLSPARITKYNARHMLRSLAEVIKLGGHAGLLVTIDDMEIICDRSSLQPMRYTKMRREDTYESVRQLIDEIDNMNNIMFLFGFDRELMDDENLGLKSYQALWMRIQNEIVGERFNRFSDIVDLDRMGHEIYDAESLVRMSERLSRIAADNGTRSRVISISEAEKLIEKSRVGNIGLPLEVNRMTLGFEEGGAQSV